jgi:predicted small integral membrane protein
MNIFFMILILFPVLSVIIGVAGYAVFKNIFVSPALVFIASMIALYIFFNETFLIWVFLYTVVTLVSGLIVMALSKKR